MDEETRKKMEKAMRERAWEREQTEEARKIANSLIDVISGSSGIMMERVAKEIAKEHPTHQQTVMRFCNFYIEAMAEQRAVDMRNEAAVEFARTVVTTIPKRAFPYI